jgi:hypothetical protein
MEPDELLPSGFVAAQTSRNEAEIGVQGTFYQIARSGNTHLPVKRIAAGRVVFVMPER